MRLTWFKFAAALATRLLWCNINSPSCSIWKFKRDPRGAVKGCTLAKLRCWSCSLVVDHLDQTTVSRHHQECTNGLGSLVTKFETDRNDRKNDRHCLLSCHSFKQMGLLWLENQNWLCKLWFRMYFFDVRLQDESSVTLVYFTTDMCVLHYCCYLMDRLNSEVRTCSIQGRCGVDPAFAHFHGFSFTMAVMADDTK